MTRKEQRTATAKTTERVLSVSHRLRKRQVQLRFTPLDYEALEKRATEAGLSLPELCKRAVFGK